MSELSEEAQRVIIVVKAIARLTREMSDLDASDFRDWSYADFVETQTRMLQGKKSKMLKKLETEGITVQYEGDVTTVLKHGQKWLEYGVWHEYGEGQQTDERLRVQLELVTQAASTYLRNTIPANANLLHEALRQAKNEE